MITGSISVLVFGQGKSSFSHCSIRTVILFASIYTASFNIFSDIIMSYFEAKSDAVPVVDNDYPHHFELREGFPYPDVDTFVGTLPIVFRGNAYNIPVEITLDRRTYPQQQPKARVCPTSNMEVVPSVNVDGETGEVRWGMYNWQGNFAHWMKELRKVFEQRPPVKSKRSPPAPPAYHQANLPEQSTKTSAELPQDPPPAYSAPVKTVPMPEERPTPVATTTQPEPVSPASPAASEREEPEPAPRGGASQPAVCCICLAEPAKFAPVPCGHLSLCHACKEAVEGQQGQKRCPMCRGEFSMIIEVFS